jgi:hypothetical protein
MPPRLRLDERHRSDSYVLRQLPGAPNATRLFYVIWRRRGSGFFSILSSVLGHLQIAEDLGAIPVVDMQNFPSTYNEREAVDGSWNSWTYYFEPVSDFNLAEVYTSSNVLVCSGAHPSGVTTDMASDERMLSTFDKYVRMNARAREHVESVASEIRPSDRTLGIHYRGRELRTMPGHPFPPTLRQVVSLTHEVLDAYDFDRIFLVTEGQEYLEAFVREFGDRVHYTSTFRLHKRNAYLSYPRLQHRFLLGLEVLTDVFVLSQCGGLICGNSNVSEAAKMINRRQYRYVRQIDLGTNSTNPLRARWLWTLKSVAPYSLGGFPAGSKRPVTLGPPPPATKPGA